jgi:uncharacterized protein YtpQ (UPF0354 family)
VSAPLTVEASLPNGMKTTTQLDNAWSECRENPPARIEWCERLLRSLPVTSSTPDARARNIVPLIRDRQFLDQVPQGGSIKAEHLVADLWIVYAEDTPQSLRYLTGDFPTSFPELRQQAIRYLRSTLPEVRGHGNGPCYMLTAGGNFEASLLLLNEIWDQQAQRVDGELVASVPSRDVVMFTGSHSQAGLTELRAVVHRIHSSGSYPISETLLVWRHGAWQEYSPSGS